MDPHELPLTATSIYVHWIAVTYQMIKPNERGPHAGVRVMPLIACQSLDMC